MPPKPAFFPTPSDFRAWFEAHYDKFQELFVGFHKKDSGKPSITWPESVDVALCFGWIDGVRRNLNETSYMIRFTPRRPTSTWSSINIKRIRELTKMGLMHPAGLKAFAARSAKKSGIYAYEQRKSAQFTRELAKRFHANKTAWEFFLAHRAFAESANSAASYAYEEEVTSPRNMYNKEHQATQESTDVFRLSSQDRTFRIFFR